MAEDFLQNDDADILCGIVSSGVGMAVSRLARQKQVILIGTDHASSRATLEEGHDYYFRVSSDTWISHAAGARYLKELQKETGWRKLAFLGPDYEYGRVAWRDLQQALALEGVRFEQTGTYWPRLYEPDYSSISSRYWKTRRTFWSSACGVVILPPLSSRPAPLACSSRCGWPTLIPVVTTRPW